MLAITRLKLFYHIEGNLQNYCLRKISYKSNFLRSKDLNKVNNECTTTYKPFFK